MKDDLAKVSAGTRMTFVVFTTAVMTMCCGAGAAEVADFVAGTGTGGWVVGAGEWSSPAYGGAVDQIRLVYGGSDPVSAAVVYARRGDGAESQVATLSAVSSAATFDFSDAVDFRSFRIAASGEWSLAAFSAEVSAASLDVPTGVAISNNVTGTSFDASWQPVVGATGYRVYAWTNEVVGASAGTEVWADDFSKAAAGGTSPKAVDSGNFNGSYSDATYWECNEYIYPSTTSGAIRLGASDKGKNGVLMSPHLPAGGNYLRMRAWRYSAEDGTDMPIMRNSGGVTSLVQIVTFTKEPGEPEDFMIRLPPLIEGDHLVFHSFTNKKPRVILDRVAIVSGYSEGSLEPLYIVNGTDVGTETSHSFTDLPSVPMQFAVEAYGRRGVTSAKTEPVTVDLANPDVVARLNACSLLSLAYSGNKYTQDFDSLAGIGTNWLNGTTLPYWQVYRGDAAVAKIMHSAGTASSGGLYALAADAKSGLRALGGITTKTDLLTWGMAFTNDTGRTMALSSVAYSAQQWGTRNTEVHNMVLSYRVADSLAWMIEETGEWTECRSTEAVGEDLPVPVLTDAQWNPGEPVAIAPDQILYLKWKVDPPTSGSAAMMGIDNVTVTFEKVPDRQGTVIKLANR